MKNLIHRILLQENTSENVLTIAGVECTVANYINNDVFLEFTNKEGVSPRVAKQVINELKNVGINTEISSRGVKGNRTVCVYSLSIEIDIVPLIAMFLRIKIKNENFFDQI